MKKFLFLFCMINLLISKEIYKVEKDEEIKKQLIIIGNSVLIEGKADSDVVVMNGDLSLYGEIKRNVAIIGGDAYLYSGSKIGGDIIVLGGKIYKEENAKIEGNITQMAIGPFSLLLKLLPPYSPKETKLQIVKPEIPKTKKKFKPFETIFLLIWGISLSVLTLIITIVAPDGVENMENLIEKKMGYSFVAGFLAQILFVPAILILIISIIGIPLIPIFIIAFILSLLISLTPSSLFVGKILKKNLNFLPKQNYFLSFLGLILLFIIWIIGNLLRIGGSIFSIFGLIINLLTIFLLYLYFTIGLGGLILSRFGTKKF